jgi:hypothetical protein
MSRMKNLFISLVGLFPMVVYSQQNKALLSPAENVWQNVGNAGFSAGNSYYTSLAFSPVDGQPYVVYLDEPIGSTDGPASLMKFDGTGWVYVGSPGFTGVTVGFTCLAFSPVDSLPYVAFAAGCSNGLQATVMKYNGTGWVFVGGGGFSQGTADFTSLAFSPSGEPYVAFTDLINANKTCVMKFDGSNWVYVGEPDFSAGEAWYNHIAFSPSGEPYVAFMDYTNGLKETIMKFDGTDWVTAGDPGFSAELEDIGFAFNPLDGKPYLAYEDASDNHRVHVKKYDGINWADIGTTDISGTNITRVCLAFNPAGHPCVSYWDPALPGVYVKEFDGTNWVNLGNAGFTAWYLDYPSFVFSPGGDPYLAYMDEGNSSKATVMKYDFPTVISDQGYTLLRVYPIPASDIITVETGPLPTNGKFSITNLNGQVVLSDHITEAKTQVNISNLPCGVYFVKLANERMVEVRKIIRQ